MEQRSDIFISYRRVGGFTVAKLLSYMLGYDGYSVFFDLETLREGDFDKQLFMRIDQCTDFLVILDPHAFDRTLDPDYDPEKDWMRKELAYALKNNKNVIPIRLPGVDFPDHLPDDIHSVTKKHSPGYSEEYFNSFFQKLKTFLHSKPSLKALADAPDTAAGAIIHLFTDTPCIVKETNRIIATVPVEEGTSIHLLKGRHRLTFISQEDARYTYRLDYDVSDVNYSDIIDISFDTLFKKEKEKAAAEQFKKGQEYYKKKDYAEAVKWYRLAAKQGNAYAQSRLGRCYYDGKGVTQDYEESVKWFRQAAEQGNAFAQRNLGYCYHNGLGVIKDYDEAVKWYRLAAEQGEASAQNSLGLCYQKGHGVTKDFDEAVKWYRLAAEQGDAVAQNNLGFCYKKGEGVKKDFDEAVKWYRLAADQGNASAQFNLGLSYKNGEGVKKDFDEAVKWFRLAAEQGNANAQKNLDTLLKEREQ